MPVTCPAPKSPDRLLLCQMPKTARCPLRGHLPFSLLEGLTPTEEGAERDSLRGSGSSLPSSASLLTRASCPGPPSLTEPFLPACCRIQKQEVISWSSSPDGVCDFPHAHGKSFRSLLSGNLSAEWPDLFGQCRSASLSFLQGENQKTKPKQTQTG